MSRYPTLAAFLPLLMFASSCERAAQSPDKAQANPARIVGISTSLPIMWREAHDISELLQPDAEPHWALAALRERGEVRPLDTLADSEGAMPLPRDAILVLAQPYPFSPDEYVALDDWVRSGGRVLLFADPMLTFHSEFSLGDRRRPQDVIKLDPILARWGLTLMRDEENTLSQSTVDVFGQPMPVALPGRFIVSRDASCETSNGGLISECAIGKGHVLAVADAALLEGDETASSESRHRVLAALLDRLAATPD